MLPACYGALSWSSDHAPYIARFATVGEPRAATGRTQERAPEETSVPLSFARALQLHAPNRPPIDQAPSGTIPAQRAYSSMVRAEDS